MQPRRIAIGERVDVGLGIRGRAGRHAQRIDPRVDEDVVLVRGFDKYASGSNSSAPSITGTPCVPLSTFEVGNIDEL